MTVQTMENARPWASSPTHMAGWECFGTEDGEPDVRRLGLVTFGPRGKSAATTEERPGTERWPAGEITNGVAAISIHTYGDHPGGAFIHVCGPDRAAVEAAWHRSLAAFVETRAALWGQS